MLLPVVIIPLSPIGAFACQPSFDPLLIADQESGERLPAVRIDVVCNFHNLHLSIRVLRVRVKRNCIPVVVRYDEEHSWTCPNLIEIWILKSIATWQQIPTYSINIVDPVADAQKLNIRGWEWERYSRGEPLKSRRSGGRRVDYKTLPGPPRLQRGLYVPRPSLDCFLLPHSLLAHGPHRRCFVISLLSPLS